MLTLDTPIQAVFTDLDDTLTLESRMPAQTYADLWRLKAAKVPVVIVSGRPAGWADCLLRLWPIEAMIFENGAGIMEWRDGRIQARFVAETSPDTAKLQSAFEKIKTDFPTAKLASDQKFRLFDYAIDFAEEPPFLEASQVEQILERLALEKGVTAKLSSIHINYWLGTHSKLTACQQLLRDMALDPKSVIFCGDSPNDEPLFEFFPQTVGVANIKTFLPKMKAKPKQITLAEGGEGFSEVVRAILGS